jgi:hypothetical protein
MNRSAVFLGYVDSRIVREIERSVLWAVAVTSRGMTD